MSLTSAALVRSLLGWKRRTCQVGRAMDADARRAECGVETRTSMSWVISAAAALGWLWSGDPGAFDHR